MFIKKHVYKETTKKQDQRKDIKKKDNKIKTRCKLVLFKI